jgi:hypothetical protein
MEDAMDSERLSHLADEAAAGVAADQEVFLEVRHELATHLEDTVARRVKEGHTPAESEDLAARAFGSAPEVAEALQQANFTRLRWRARARILFAAVIVPIVLVLALYLGYGRFARLMDVLQYGIASKAARVSYYSDSPPMPRLPQVPQVPGFTFQLNESPSSRPMAVMDPTNPEHLYAYWQAHRSEPGAERYFACWYALTWPSSRDRSHGEETRIDPNNALYDVLRASDLFSSSLESIENQNLNATEDKVKDRSGMDRAIAALHAAVRKPYLRTDEYPLMREYLAAQSAPALTEDYLLLRQERVGSLLFPVYERYHALSGSIPGAVRILIKEGKYDEAEALLDIWKPYARLFITDPDPTQRENTVIADEEGEWCAYTFAKAARDWYPALGRPHKAADARKVFLAIRALVDNQSDRSAAIQSELFGYPPQKQLLLRDGPAIFVVKKDYVLPFSYYSSYDLRPARMHEHVMAEEMATQVAIVLLTLALLANLLRGALAWFMERKRNEYPVRLIPSAALLGRAIFWGVVVPIICYTVYSRLPGIGGREYGWAVMWPRFSAELALLIVVVMSVPRIILSRGLRKRWDTLGIAAPTKSNDPWTFPGIAFIVVAGTASLCLSGGLAVSHASDTVGMPVSSEGFAALNVWSVGILVAFFLAVVFQPLHLLRKTHLRFCGAASRATSVLLASVILTLGLLQPLLLWQEASWLSQDTVGIGASGRTYGSQVEADAEQYLHTRLVAALEAK